MLCSRLGPGPCGQGGREARPRAEPGSLATPRSGATALVKPSEALTPAPRTGSQLSYGVAGRRGKTGPRSGWVSGPEKFRHPNQFCGPGQGPC